MYLKSLVAFLIGFVMLNTWANEKIVADLDKLAPDWTLIGDAKVVDEDGVKFIKMEVPEKGFSGLSYKDISISNVKQVKISMAYRTNVPISKLHTGSWVLVGFKGADGKFKFEGLFFAYSTQWANAEKVFDVPEASSALRIELRLQDGRDGNMLDVHDICVELIK